MVLSVIIPAYNVSKTIKRCIDSLLDERINDCIEIIVVNDGSSDDTEEIAEAYREKYGQVIKVISKKNGGHGSTLNVGFLSATGKYVRVIDGDDWVEHENFVKSVFELQSITADIIVMPYQRVDINTYESQNFGIPNYCVNHIYDIASLDTTSLYFALAAVCVSNDLMRRACIHFPEKTYYVDVLLNTIPVFYIRNICFMNYDVYRYGVGNNEQSISVPNMVRRYKDHEKVIKMVLDACKTNQLRLNTPEKKYIDKVLKEIVNTHFKILYFGLKDKSEIRKFKELLCQYGVNYGSYIDIKIFLMRIKSMLYCFATTFAEFLRMVYKKLF